ncbi:MAG: hypothetical protein HUU21_37130 [Polyangiaceae bacterium]|nr:hypothetical protein [Polyangiaceae bacterium]
MSISRSRRWIRRAIAVIAQAVCLLGGTAAAEPISAFVVDVESSDPSLPPADVRSIVADKLGATVLAVDEPGAGQVRRSITILVRRPEKQIIITYKDATGLEKSEMLRLSADPASNAEAIASAVGALVGETRDQGVSIEKHSVSNAPAPAALPPPEIEDPDAPKASVGYFPVNLSFIYPLAFNVGRPILRTNLDIALLVSHVGEVDGAQVGLVTYTVLDVEGVQASVGALTGGHMTGIQLGGTFAYAGGGITGAQASGIFGWSTKEVRGVQLAGVAAQTYEDIDGLQLSGAFNIARRQVTGAQIAGGVNMGRVRGFQLGLINVSAEVDGLQVGLINIARRIDGLQVGLINVTASLAGESLGLVNILKPGRIHLTLWGSNSLLGNAGVKFASKYAYSIVSAAIHNLEGEVAAGAGLTLGVHLPLKLYLPGLTVSGDFGAYRLFPSGFNFTGHAEVYKTRLIASYELAHRLTLFVGGGAHLSVTGDENETTSFGPELSGGLEL